MSDIAIHTTTTSINNSNSNIKNYDETYSPSTEMDTGLPFTTTSQGRLSEEGFFPGFLYQGAIRPETPSPCEYGASCSKGCHRRNEAPLTAAAIVFIGPVAPGSTGERERIITRRLGGVFPSRYQHRETIAGELPSPFNDEGHIGSEFLPHHVAKYADVVTREAS